MALATNNVSNEKVLGNKHITYASTWIFSESRVKEAISTFVKNLPPEADINTSNVYTVVQNMPVKVKDVLLSQKISDRRYIASLASQYTSFFSKKYRINDQKTYDLILKKINEILNKSLLFNPVGGINRLSGKSYIYCNNEKVINLLKKQDENGYLFKRRIFKGKYAEMDSKQAEAIIDDFRSKNHLKSFSCNFTYKEDTLQNLVDKIESVDSDFSYDEMKNYLSKSITSYNKKNKFFTQELMTDPPSQKYNKNFVTSFLDKMITSDPEIISLANSIPGFKIVSYFTSDYYKNLENSFIEKKSRRLNDVIADSFENYLDRVYPIVEDELSDKSSLINKYLFLDADEKVSSIVSGTSVTEALSQTRDLDLIFDKLFYYSHISNIHRSILELSYSDDEPENIYNELILMPISVKDIDIIDLNSLLSKFKLAPTKQFSEALKMFSNGYNHYLNLYEKTFNEYIDNEFGEEINDYKYGAPEIKLNDEEKEWVKQFNQKLREGKLQYSNKTTEYDPEATYSILCETYTVKSYVSNFDPDLEYKPINSVMFLNEQGNEIEGMHASDMTIINNIRRYFDFFSEEEIKYEIMLRPDIRRGVKIENKILHVKFNTASDAYDCSKFRTKFYIEGIKEVENPKTGAREKVKKVIYDNAHILLLNKKESQTYKSDVEEMSDIRIYLTTSGSDDEYPIIREDEIIKIVVKNLPEFIKTRFTNSTSVNYRPIASPHPSNVWGTRNQSSVSNNPSISGTPTSGTPSRPTSSQRTRPYPEMEERPRRGERRRDVSPQGRRLGSIYRGEEIESEQIEKESVGNRTPIEEKSSLKRPRSETPQNAEEDGWTRYQSYSARKKSSRENRPANNVKSPARPLFNPNVSGNLSWGGYSVERSRQVYSPAYQRETPRNYTPNRRSSSRERGQEVHYPGRSSQETYIVDKTGGRTEKTENNSNYRNDFDSVRFWSAMSKRVKEEAKEVEVQGGQFQPQRNRFFERSRFETPNQSRSSTPNRRGSYTPRGRFAERYRERYGERRERRETPRGGRYDRNTYDRGTYDRSTYDRSRHNTPRSNEGSRYNTPREGRGRYERNTPSEERRYISRRSNSRDRYQTNKYVQEKPQNEVVTITNASNINKPEEKIISEQERKQIEEQEKINESIRIQEQEKKQEELNKLQEEIEDIF